MALTDEQRDQIWTLWVQRTPKTAIARTVGVNRHTVTRVLTEIRSQLAAGREAQLEEARDEALAVYDAVQQAAWAARSSCEPTSNASVGYLSVVVDAQRQKDRLLGIEQMTVNLRGMHLARIEAVMETPVPVRLATEEEHG